MRHERVTAAAVEQRLAEAGRVLLALPHAGCFPSGFRTLWPAGDGDVAPARRFVPSAADISAMDEAYRWVGLIDDVDERRLVLMRSLVRIGPDGAPRPVWSWRRLQRSTGRHPRTLRVIWGRGIDRIVRGLNRRASESAREAERRTERACQAEWPEWRGGNRGKVADEAGIGLHLWPVGGMWDQFPRKSAILAAF